MVEIYEVRQKTNIFEINPDPYPDDKQEISKRGDEPANLFRLVMKKQKEEEIREEIRAKQIHDHINHDHNKEVPVHDTDFSLKDEEISAYFSVSEEDTSLIKSHGDFNGITIYPYKSIFLEKLGKWLNRGLKYGLVLSLLSIIPLDNFKHQNTEYNISAVHNLIPKSINVNYETRYDKKISVKKGLLKGIQDVFGLKGKKLLEKNEEIVNYNILNHPDKNVRERIGYDLCKFENGKKVMKEDGIRGDDIPSDHVLCPVAEIASKSLTILVDGYGNAVANGKTSSIDDYIRQNVPENAIIKNWNYFEEEKNVEGLVQIYNNYGINKLKEVSNLNNNEIYKKLNEARKQGHSLKYSSYLMNNMQEDERRDFWRLTTAVYLNGKTVKNSLKQIEKETGIRMSESTMYRGITKYTDEIGMPKEVGVQKIRKSSYMKWKPTLYS